MSAQLPPPPQYLGSETLVHQMTARPATTTTTLPRPKCALAKPEEEGDSSPSPTANPQSGGRANRFWNRSRGKAAGVPHGARCIM